MPQRIIIIRHGETDHNIQGICQGQLNIALNSQGLKQAQQLARRLQNETVDVLYSSDLKRCLQTTMPVANMLKLKPKLEKAIREFDFGELQGKAWVEIRAKSAEILDQIEAMTDVHFNGHKGESRHQFRVRLQSFIDELRRTDAGKKVMIVTHGGAKRVLMELLGHSMPREVYSIGNTAVSILEKDNHGRYKLVKFNDVSHLANTTSLAPSDQDAIRK